MSAAVGEAVDTSDLDMLDGIRHCACWTCYPNELPFGARYIATCGREVIASGRTDFLTPPNACGDCERLRYDAPCPRCGANP